MIRSFRCQETRAIHEGFSGRRFRGIEEQARKRLRWLDAATSLADLAAIRGNRLEALKGRPDRPAQRSDQRPLADLLFLARRERA
jgi:proteic killer suppression protein